MERKQQAALWAHLAAIRLQHDDIDGAHRALDSASGMLFIERLPSVWSKRGREREAAEESLKRLTTVTEPAYS